jgi:hypothetical protein
MDAVSSPVTLLLPEQKTCLRYPKIFFQNQPIMLSYVGSNHITPPPGNIGVAVAVAARKVGVAGALSVAVVAAPPAMKAQ